MEGSHPATESVAPGDRKRSRIKTTSQRCYLKSESLDSSPNKRSQRSHQKHRGEQSASPSASRKQKSEMATTETPGWKNQSNIQTRSHVEKHKPTLTACNPSTKLENLLWQVDAQYCFDVLFLPDGRLVTCESYIEKVHLYSKEGQLMRSYSCDMRPWRLAYHPQLKSVLVVPVNESDRIPFLDQDTLKFARDFNLEDARCRGVSVLQDGTVATRPLYGRHMVLYTPQGELIQTFDTSGHSPYYFTADPQDRIYVTFHDRPGFCVYSKKGQLLHDISPQGVGRCRGVKVDPSGLVWLVDGDNKCVSVVSLDDQQKLSSPIQGLQNPHGIAVWQERVAVSDTKTKTVSVYTW